MKNLKNRMKAPHDLKVAVKKGERLERTYYGETPKAGARRFALAFAGYACIAMLLLGGVIVLPALLNGQAPVAQSTATTTVAEPEGYVKPSGVDAKNFIYPDLIWASHLNMGLENFVLWSADIDENGAVEVTTPFTRPDVGEETADYAVEVRIVYFETKEVKSAVGSRHLASVTYKLEELGIETLKNSYGNDMLMYADAKPLEGNPYYSKVCVLGQNQFTEAVEKALVEKITTIENARVEIRIAWQPRSTHPADPDQVIETTPKYNEATIWFADWYGSGISDEYEISFPFDETWPVCQRIDDKEYFVHISIGWLGEDTLIGERYSKFENQIAKMEEALKAAGFVESDLQVQDNWPRDEYYAVCYDVIGKDLSEFDPESIMTYLREVDADLSFEMKILEPAGNTATGRR